MTLFVWVGCGTAVAAQVCAELIFHRIGQIFAISRMSSLSLKAIDVFNGTSGTSAAFLIATSLAFGIGICVLAYTIAPVSGE